MREFLVMALLASMAFAGCIDSDGSGGPGSGTIDPSWSNERRDLPDDFMPHGDDHDHNALSEHQFLWNYEFVQHDPLGANPVSQSGLHAMIRQGDYLYGAVWGSHDASADGGLVIWDISDPLNPVRVSQYILPGTVGGDRSIGVTPDGDYAVLGAEKLDCFGHINVNVAISAYLFDTSDKTNPVLVDTLTTTSQSLGTLDAPQPIVNGIHSVEVANIGGVDYAVLSGEVYRIDREATVPGIDASGQLVLVSSIPVGHDIYIRETPWGETWGLTATETTFLLQNLDDIENPETISTWHLDSGGSDPREGNGLAYYYHTADVAFFGDQTLVVQVSEDAGEHLSPFWILDITDPSEPIYLNTWTNPSGVPATLSAIFSQHNQRFHDDGILTLTHYHGGMIQFDFRHPDFRAEPEIIAYAAYSAQQPPAVGDPSFHPVETYCGLSAADEPRVPEALMYVDLAIGDDGILYIADITGGLLTFKPTAEHPVYGELWA